MTTRLRKPRPPLVGRTEPRVFTPPLRELTPETSLGFAVIEFATEILGLTLLPWQKWLLIHALELLEDGTFRFRTVIVLVARQNGKSTLAQVLALFFMYVKGAALVIGTAQNLDIAEEVWEGAVNIAEEVEELANEIKHIHRVNGKKALQLRGGERYKVQTANRRGGRGLSGDLILLDELREHQTWDSWGAITKTTMARAYAQIWGLSNAGDASSVVLRHLRKMAHLHLGDPDGINREIGDELDQPIGEQLAELDEDFDDEDFLDPDEELDDESLGIFEWSAPPNIDRFDRDGWTYANPSLGYTITERAIRSASRTDPEWTFRTEVLCQWSDGTLEGPFPQGTWEAGRVTDSEIPPDADTIYSLDVAWDRSVSHVAVAGLREDGKAHVEIVASRAGTNWVLDWFQVRADVDNPLKVVVQARGAPASSFVTDLEGMEGIELIQLGGSDLGTACGKFYDLVINDGLRHLPQPVLDVPAATAVTKPLGDAWVWNRKGSPLDVSPLQAATGAVWALLTHEGEELADSVYEEHDLMVV